VTSTHYAANAFIERQLENGRPRWMSQFGSKLSLLADRDDTQSQPSKLPGSHRATGLLPSRFGNSIDGVAALRACFLWADLANTAENFELDTLLRQTSEEAADRGAPSPRLQQFSVRSHLVPDHRAVLMVICCGPLAAGYFVTSQESGPRSMGLTLKYA
jgi:hypothetical protein